MENPKFEMKNARNGEFYFVLRAKNGEIVLTASETYTTKQNCEKGIASVKENAPYSSRYETNDSLRNYTFNLKASNGRILGRSESYTTARERDDGIAAVKRDAPGAPTEDLT